jgi:hypothetical protein
MARVENNREFLTNFVISSSRSRSQLIKAASDEEVKSLFEVCYNINSFPFTKKESRLLFKYRSQLKSFIKRKWKLKQLRAYFIKRQKLLGLVLSVVLSKIVDGTICSLLGNVE